MKCRLLHFPIPNLEKAEEAAAELKAAVCWVDRCGMGGEPTAARVAVSRSLNSHKAKINNFIEHIWKTKIKDQ